MQREYKGFIVFGLGAFVLLLLYVHGTLPSFTEIVAMRDEFRTYAMSMPLIAGAVFCLLYVAVVGLSIPLATPLSLLAGYLFGPIIGTGLVVLSATGGATCIFMLARYFFRDAFKRVFGPRLSFLEDEFGTHGFRDVLVLRLTPLVPFSLINVGAALSATKTYEYILATFIGIMPFSYLYVAAGVEIGRITSPHEIVSMDIIWQRSLLAFVAFTLLYIGSYRRKNGPSRVTTHE